MSKSQALPSLLVNCSIRFGTSGVRGLVRELNDRICYAFTLAFLQHLEQLGELHPGDEVAIGGDLRESTGRILLAVGLAISDRGYHPRACGRLPSPALALYGLEHRAATVMVTGSHIPDDRNGIKFTRARGEILKADERSIIGQQVTLPDCFDAAGQLQPGYVPDELPESDAAARGYVRRWLEGFAPSLLRGCRLGLYEHSAVGRDLLNEILTGLGAEVVRFGRSDAFIPVDTEAIRPEDVELARRWANEQRFDTILSTDGDSDRPLISDERGRWLRGDVAGILCARFLGADVVVTPVSCNTAVEACDWFSDVRRTRIGSPYVIEAMDQAVAEGARTVVGYEANGGFLIATDIERTEVKLRALPTRDPVVVQLSLLALARDREVALSELLGEVPERFTASDRLQQFPTERSAARLQNLIQGGRAAIEESWGPHFGSVRSTDVTDGLRVTFASGEILHLRPSGNAPEFRCYAEAATDARAREMTSIALSVLETWRG